jgi:hypothetical protein
MRAFEATGKQLCSIRQRTVGSRDSSGLELLEQAQKSLVVVQYPSQQPDDIRSPQCFVGEALTVSCTMVLRDEMM